MAVGDINSTERGSGARYNDGKPVLSLIPLVYLAETLPLANETAREIALCLRDLGRFQTTADTLHLRRTLTRLAPRWEDCARVYEYGKQKYAAWNWAKGMDWSIPLACAARHALKIIRGEEIDAESHLPHVGHFMANVVMSLHFAEHYPEGNDLPDPAHFRAPPVPEGDT